MFLKVSEKSGKTVVKRNGNNTNDCLFLETPFHRCVEIPVFSDELRNVMKRRQRNIVYTERSAVQSTHCSSNFLFFFVVELLCCSPSSGIKIMLIERQEHNDFSLLITDSENSWKTVKNGAYFSNEELCWEKMFSEKSEHNCSLILI